MCALRMEMWSSITLFLYCPYVLCDIYECNYVVFTLQMAGLYRNVFLLLFISLCFTCRVVFFELQKLEILIWWYCIINLRMPFCSLSSQSNVMPICECMWTGIKTRLNVWSCLFSIYLRTPLLISWLSDACIEFVSLRHMRAVLSSFQKQE